ncbi:MAG: T9SS type A sorting domain-containing protein [Flavobacteriales bacterium]
MLRTLLLLLMLRLDVRAFVMRALLTPLAVLLVQLVAHGLQVTVNVQPGSCGLANGQAWANASGGTPPYTYLWSNSATTQSISGLVAGNYSVTVTDALSATANSSGFVSNTGQLNMSGSSSATLSCACDGTVTVAFDNLNGVPPYTLLPPPSTQDASSALYTNVCAPNNLSFTVTDSQGCTGSTTVNVPGPITPTFSSVQTTDACAGGANGSVFLELFSPEYEFGDFATLEVTGISGLVYSTDLPATIVLPYQNTITDLLPGDYTATVNVPFELCPSAPTSVSTQFTIGNNTSDCGGLSGTVWADVSGDCTVQGNEPRLPFRIATIQPGPHYALTNASGVYNIGLTYGNFTVEVDASSNLLTTCPPAPFTLDPGTTNVSRNIGLESVPPFDLEAEVSVGVIRPGFAAHAWVKVLNQGMIPSNTIMFSLTYDPVLSFQSASMVPVVNSPGYLEWSLNALPGFGASPTIDVILAAPPNPGLLGTDVILTATCSDGQSEVNLTNNTVTVTRTITGSYDPNDKQGATSSGLSATQYFLPQDSWIDYTVRFQNTGTAAAETVTIRDTIDTNLFIPSLEILGASHAFTPSFGQDRELVFIFDNIDLPDSTTDLLGSQGFISYRIKPNNDIIVGDVLENTAGIYFDLNPPIITNTTSHVVDFNTGTACEWGPPNEVDVYPNPADHLITVVLNDPATRILGVFNASGSLVQLPMEHRADGAVIDVSRLPAGLYAVRSTKSFARFAKR